VQRKIALVLAGICAVLFAGFLASRIWFRTYRIPTGTMDPTIPVGCGVVVRVQKSAARGDIIAFRYPLDPKTTFLKRVAAVGGDIVEIRDKHLYVNGAEAREPYVVHTDEQTYPNLVALPEPYRSRDQFGPYRVPNEHYFVLGDNRDRSSDSRYWGPVPAANLTGRVVAAYTFTRFWRPT